MTDTYAGSCLCGAIGFTVAAPIEDVSHCHCSMCRKAHGAACGTYGNVAAARFAFVRGTELLATYRSSPTVERLFCPRCGAPLVWRDETRFPGRLGFALGALDTPFVPARQRHIFVGSKAAWDEICDRWPQQP